MSTELTRIDDIKPLLEVIIRQLEKDRELLVCDRTTSLKNLYQAALVEAARLRDGESEIVTVCVAVRNLFEIMLLINYLAASDEAVECWVGQLQGDALDIHNGLISLFQKHGVQSLPLENSRSNVLAKGDERGVVPSRPFNIKGIAGKLGVSEDYDAMCKLCSKIVHPSSIRVNLPGTFEKNGDYKNALIHAGIHYLAQIAESSRRDFA